MTIYLINIGITLLFGLVLLQKSPVAAFSLHVRKPVNTEAMWLFKKKVFVFLATVQWILLSGLRHMSVGADTENYRIYFLKDQMMTWEEAANNFIGVYFQGVEGKDPGYVFFEKLCGNFTQNYQVYLIIIAIVFFVPFGYFIYKNSCEPTFSFLIFSSLFYAFFAITGHRQTIATALSVLIGYELIKKRKLVPFILLVLIASTIHKTALLFLIFYFAANIKITKGYVITMLVSIFTLFVFKDAFAVFVKVLSGYQKDYAFAYADAGTQTFTLMFTLVTAVALWKMNTVLKNNPNAKHYYNALFLAFLFVPLTFVNPSAMRVVQYFSLFLVFLIPEVIRAFNKKERPLVYVVAAGVLLVLFIRTDPQYLFFWQQLG